MHPVFLMAWFIFVMRVLNDEKTGMLLCFLGLGRIQLYINKNIRGQGEMLLTNLNHNHDAITCHCFEFARRNLSVFMQELLV